ncbi:MAG: M48 family metallopeptidase [Methanomicrobiales archaeon]|nr:M48 family metallopeptidase [Methanomicrobiales archaeon]
MADIPVDEIIRSRRKTISLMVTSDCRVIVRAPMKLSQVRISQFVSARQNWIAKTVEKMKGRPQAVPHAYTEGELFWFLGREYPLHFVDDDQAIIERTDRLCVPRAYAPDIGRHIRQWYVREAEKEIRSRCMWFSMMTGYSPASIRITDAQKRWGSCTHKGGLNFSWRLIQAPLEIVDYVILHELVHLRQMDHSPRFWKKVEELMPDYERRKQWLRENERLLRI